MRLLTYNVRYAGTGREDFIAPVISACAPDIVVLQEAERPDIVRYLAERCGMPEWGAQPGKSLAFLSRMKIAHHAWHRPRWASRAYLELVPESVPVRVFAVHLAALHSNVTEARRLYELRALLKGVAAHQNGFHAVIGDFNTLAPGEQLDVGRLPARLKALVWMTGRRIRFVTIQAMLDAGYTDAYRACHPEGGGHTFPTWDPHIRLDYMFVPTPFVSRVVHCEVATSVPHVREASDHFPLAFDLDVK
jgi:exodeoxyribonuclease III